MFYYYMLITIGFKNLSIIIMISIVLIGLSLGGSVFKMFSFLNPFGALGKIQGITKKKK